MVSLTRARGGMWSRNGRVRGTIRIVPLRVSIPEQDDPRLTEDVYPLLRVLRPGLTQQDFERLLEEGGKQGLTPVIATADDGQCVGAAMYRVMVTSRGKLLFIDDLVTDPESRSAGIGAALLAELEQRGREAGCDRIELDSGMSNQAAHRFYYRHRLGAIALHFAKPLGDE